MFFAWWGIIFGTTFSLISIFSTAFSSLFNLRVWLLYVLANYLFVLVVPSRVTVTVSSKGDYLVLEILFYVLFQFS